MNIGDKVVKISGKPFKSKLKVATIKSICINEQDPKKKLAATFEEDDSVVSIDKLQAAVNPVQRRLSELILSPDKYSELDLHTIKNALSFIRDAENDAEFKSDVALTEKFINVLVKHRENGSNTDVSVIKKEIFGE